jgi:hypothetical protein
MEIATMMIQEALVVLKSVPHDVVLQDDISSAMQQADLVPLGVDVIVASSSAPPVSTTKGSRKKLLPVGENVPPHTSNVINGKRRKYRKCGLYDT